MTWTVDVPERSALARNLSPTTTASLGVLAHLKDGEIDPVRLPLSLAGE